jgi:hypothetical protein
MTNISSKLSHRRANFLLDVRPKIAVEKGPLTCCEVIPVFLVEKRSYWNLLVV